MSDNTPMMPAYQPKNACYKCGESQSFRPEKGYYDCFNSNCENACNYQPLPKIRHCQVCQTYKDGLKEYGGQMVCAACRQKLEGKRLAKAQQSFFDDQQPLFSM